MWKHRDEGEVITSIDDLDLATFCGTIGKLYVRYRLSPPFVLYAAAQRWIGLDIPLSHCVDVIERHLSRYSGRYLSGSGDRHFAWLSGFIETSRYDRLVATPPWTSSKQASGHDWLSEHDSPEPNERLGRRESFAAGLPGRDSKDDSFKPERMALRPKGPGVSSPATDTKSASRQPIRPSRQRGASRLLHQTPASIPRKIDVAVAWLRAELANGERTAVEVESNAVCAGIAPRTYDRARKRLGVTSRRIGFGRCATYMIALPGVHGTPREGRTRRALHGGSRKRKRG